MPTPRQILRHSSIGSRDNASASPRSTQAPEALPITAASSASLIFPMPASHVSRTIVGRPALAESNAARTAVSSFSRPTSAAAAGGAKSLGNPAGLANTGDSDAIVDELTVPVGRATN